MRKGHLAMPPDFHSARLHLRPLGPGDAPAVFAYASQPGFFRYLDHVPERIRTSYEPSDAQVHIRELQALAADGFPHWAIVPHDVGVPVGAIRFHPAADVVLPELGYGLGPAWWGRGYATEAARAVLPWALRQVPAIVARTSPENTASQRVLDGLGFTRTGMDARGRWTYMLRAR